MAVAGGLTPSLFRIKASSGTSSKQRKRIRRPQNVDGEFFVDNTCIDCDTCRWMAPETFNRQGHMSAVFKQPTCEEERLKALQALLSCPTNSIHTEEAPRDILDVHKTFPIPVDEQRVPVSISAAENLYGIYHCGFHSEKSFGAASYIITRPEGNILIDSPRYTPKLASNIKKLGGAKFMFLTHKDDIADHDKWSKELGCERILHSEEVTHGTSNVEIKLEGNGPWNIDNDITLIHTPGHTEGSVCLLDKTRKVLFSGDHVFASEEEDKLTISERYNFFSVSVQLQSIEKLIDVDFEWILPGHGRRAEFKDTEEKNLALQALLDGKGVRS